MDSDFMSSDDDVQFCSEKSSSTPPPSWEPGSDSQTPSTTDKDKYKKRCPRKCAKCRNHNQDEMWKGHKRFCLWRDCYCKLCILVDQRRDNTKKGAKLRREQLQDQGRGHMTGNGSVYPDTNAICRLDEHRLEENLSKMLRSTPVRSSSVLFLALLRSCAMDISQAVATIGYAFEEMKSIAPNLTVADFTARYAVFPKPADLSMLCQSLPSVMTPSLTQSSFPPSMTHTSMNLNYPRYAGALYNMHFPIDLSAEENIVHQRYGSEVSYVAPPNVALAMSREQQVPSGVNFGYTQTPVLDPDIYSRESYYPDNSDQTTPDQ